MPSDEEKAVGKKLNELMAYPLGDLADTIQWLHEVFALLDGPDDEESRAIIIRRREIARRVINHTGIKPANYDEAAKRRLKSDNPNSWRILTAIEVLNSGIAGGELAKQRRAFINGPGITRAPTSVRHRFYSKP